MKFTDLFVNKPVLSIVVSLFILLFGLRAFSELNVRQYPEMRNAVVNISTTYFGADADLIQGFITTPLEREIASAEGIDYLASTSSAGVSSIQAYIRLDADPSEALTQISAKVNKMRGQLPPESEDPVIDLQQGQQIAAMYVSFASEQLDNNQITDYLVRGAHVGEPTPQDALAQSSAFRFESDGPVSSFYWVDDGFGYALSGDLPREVLLALATAIHPQL